MMLIMDGFIYLSIYLTVFKEVFHNGQCCQWDMLPMTVKEKWLAEGD